MELKSTFFSGIFTFRRDALLSMNPHQMSTGENVETKKTTTTNVPTKQPRVPHRDALLISENLIKK